MTLVAAIQLQAALGDTEANLAACERLADEAGQSGATVIALPEFFPTGIGFDPGLTRQALPPDGAATELLVRIARRYRAIVGGSFLCRDDDGHVRNAYMIATAEGIAGRHDKDLPTMWENAIYIGGAQSDIGLIETDSHVVGAAVCWELMRTATVHRLRDRVDFAMTGSGWWSMPDWPPRQMWGRLEARNRMTARTAAATFARYIGAPVIHAAHAGDLQCRCRGSPWPTAEPSRERA